MFGLLNIDKPAGVTSRDVVNRVQRLIRPLKVGHAGTLDPLATGVLVVAIGQATRLVEYVQGMPKTYHGTFLLGRTSDTEDIEGNVVEMAEFRVPSREELEVAAHRFMGRIEQRPPAYSALKVAGRRAYNIARGGGIVDLAPRTIEVHELRIVCYDYPELELMIRCGSGTYVRSLGRDLAEAVGTGAVMSGLRRLAIGPFNVEDAIQLLELDLSVIHSCLLSPLLAVGDLPAVRLDDHETKCVVQGQLIKNRWNAQYEELAAVDCRGNLIAMLSPVSEALLRPTKCFLSQ
jgi:tRNA pseudouridine55 synthase